MNATIITRLKTAAAATALIAGTLLTAMPAAAQSTASKPYFCQYTLGLSSATGCYASQTECDTAQNASGACQCMLDPTNCPVAGAGGSAGAGGTTGSTTKLDDPLGNADIPTVVGRFIDLLVGISGSLALLMFIWGGFQMVISQGNEKTYARGLNSVKWAGLGLVLLFVSYAILTFIFNALGAAGSV